MTEAKAATRKQRDEWEIDDDLRTLARAAEIQKDKGRMADVKKLAKKKLADLQSIAAAK